MLASKRFPEILKSIISDGVDGAMIITIEGSVLASDFASTISNGNIMTETSFAAIVSSIWYNYMQGIGSSVDLGCYIGKYEKGSIAIAPAGKNYIVAVYGTSVSLGLLRGRVEALSQYFNRIFEQLK